MFHVVIHPKIVHCFPCRVPQIDVIITHTQLHISHARFIPKQTNIDETTDLPRTYISFDCQTLTVSFKMHFKFIWFHHHQHHHHPSVHRVVCFWLWRIMCFSLNLYIFLLYLGILHINIHSKRTHHYIGIVTYDTCALLWSALYRIHTHNISVMFNRKY